MAYCLMGLFEINMPMLYGEGGERAFVRLQEEIIKTSDDMSIFAWKDPAGSFSTYRGLLARHPPSSAGARTCSGLAPKPTLPYHVTNKGIRIDLVLKPGDVRGDQYTAFLGGVTDENVPIAIYLQKVGEDQYARVEPAQVVHCPRPRKLGGSNTDNLGVQTTVYVRQKITMERADPFSGRRNLPATQLGHPRTGRCAGLLTDGT